jgi:hypothetical protein
MPGLAAIAMPTICGTCVRASLVMLIAPARCGSGPTSYASA